MGMEVVGAEAAPVQVKVSDGEVNLFQENESKATAKDREEAAVFGADTNGPTNVSDLAPPKDAKEEWPEPKQTYTFYFVKVRSLEDPKLRAKLEQADKEFQKKIQARSKLIEAVRAKKAERSNIISELKPLTAENRQYNEVVSEKLKEMEPLRNSLGKFRDENNAMRQQSAGLCSSIEELEQTIKMLNDRIVHESIPLAEEKRLVKEIKDLEKTRSKVLSNVANRAKLQDTVVEKEAIQDQVKIIGEGIDGIKKERQAVRSKIKVLEDELKAVDAEIASLQEDLDAATARKDKAYESLLELRHARDANNASFIQNRAVLTKARDYSSRNMLTELQELHKTEVDKFMTQWCHSKAFREDYEKRVLSTFNGRQLSRDGRMRNPDEKPIFIETHTPAPTAEPEPLPVKLPAKAKEAPAQADEAPKVEARSKGPVKSLKGKAAPDDDDDYEPEPPKEKQKPKEADVAKLKEMKRQEEIEKNRLALERKKRQAEKQAAKAAARAQKEAEKKLKKEEKKAKKKAGTADTDEPSESEAKSDEAADAQTEEEAAPASVQVKKEQKENARHRNTVTRTKVPPPKVVLKRKKAQSYWSWAGPAAAVAAVLVALLAVLGYYQYYLPASSASN
ncbi:hypothetical protein ACP4OV_023745 [Aristida adscensionis]